MAFDVVTAKQGKPHVTADQQALMQAGMLGKGRYALDALNNLACTMTDSNTLTVDTGGLMVDGRWVVNEAQTSFTIANGSQAQFRKDLAALEITVDPSTGVTSLEEKVLQGATAATEAAAADSTYDPGDLYTGLTAVVPIARITLDGLTPTCEALLPSVADLKTISEQTKKLGDSVSQFKVETKDFWTVMTLPTGLRVAWTTEYTGVVGANDGFKKEIALPFSVDNPKKLCVVSSLTGTDEKMPDYFNSLTVKVNVTSTHAVALIWNDSQVQLESLFSIIVMERTVY